MPYRPTQLQRRSRFARTNGDLLVNRPEGFPSGSEPATIWWMGSDSPLIVQTPRAALAAVTRATNLIVNTITSLPWRHLDNGAREYPTPRWINDPMLSRPDARISSSPTPAAIRLPRAQFWSQWIRSALMHGMGYLLFEEDPAGTPVAGTMRVLNPDSVAPLWHPDGGYAYRRIGVQENGVWSGAWVDTDLDGRTSIGGRTYRLVELRNPTAQADELGVTLGVLEMHAREIGLAIQALNYSSSMYRSGVPAGYLKVNVPNYDKDRADKLKSQWLAAHGNDDRSVAVLNATTDFQPLSWKPIDADLINARQMSLVDIANMFGVPTFFLGYDGSGSNTYSTAESRGNDLRQSVLHWANAAEDTLSPLMPQSHYIEVDFRGLLRPDTKTRYESYSRAIADGWLTVDEVRAFENMKPLEGTATGAMEDTSWTSAS